MEERIEISLGESNDGLAVVFPQESLGADIPLEVNAIVKKEGLLVDDAMTYIKEAAAGKKKIAVSLRDKGAPTTEYDTFDEMAEHIDMLPLPVEGEDGVYSPNGGVLKFYDVYNELRKVNTLYGSKYPYCCALELYSEPACDTVTLSGADAYFTSDWTLYEKTSVHTFNDSGNDYGNRFVVYMFKSLEYSVPFNLPSGSVDTIFVLNGRANISISSGSFRRLLNYSDERLNATGIDKYRLSGISELYEVYDNALEKISGGSPVFDSIPVRQLSLPNLTSISNVGYVFRSLGVRRLYFPRLKTISGVGYLLEGLGGLTELDFPVLGSITNSSIIYINNGNIETVRFPSLEVFSGTLLSGQCPKLTTLLMPKLREHKNYAYPLVTSNALVLKEIDLPLLVNAGALMNFDSILESISLGAPVGGNIRVCRVEGTKQNNTLTTLTVGEGFRSRLDCTACNALTRDSLVGILNNLADNTDGAAINIIFGAVNLAKLTEDEIAVGTSKNYTIS